MKNLVLFGFMGCGKSTVGALLAEKTGCPCLDTDRFLEQTYDKEIPQIFAEEGEDAFRDKETEICRVLSGKKNLVICCGGGTVLREENARALSENSRMIFLDIPFEEAYRRIQSSDRPLVRNNTKEGLQAIFASRHPIYQSRAHLTVDAAQSPEQVVKAILKRIK